MEDDGGYRLGDVANGYVLTEHGWTPIGAQPQPSQEPPAPRQYRVGDVANGYVLTEQGWTPLGPGAAPPTQPMPTAYGSQPAYASQSGYRPVQPAYQPAPGTGGRRGLWIVLAVVAVVLVGAAVAVVVALLNARTIPSPRRRRTGSTVDQPAEPSSTAPQRLAAARRRLRRVSRPSCGGVRPWRWR